MHKIIKTLLALPFLPAEHIPPAFTYLQGKAATDQLNELMRYVETTWINGRIWRPRAWSIYQQSVRTNNDVEGWHNRINRKARRGQLPFYLLIRLLHEESQMVRLQARLLSEGKLSRYQRSKYRTMQGQIFREWEDYSTNQKSAISLLRRCAAIYGPVITA